MQHLYGRIHADLIWAGHRAVRSAGEQHAARRLTDSRGQATVEYVGLMLLVSLLMVGMVGAMTKFRGDQGTQLAEAIANKIKEAVQKVDYR